MSKENIILAVWLLVAATCFGLGFGLGRRCCRNTPPTPVKVVTDTLLVHDTISVREPVYIAKTVIEKVPIPVTDTLRLHDTLVVYLDREQLEWRDSLCTVWASGIRPSVDSVRHYITEKVITTTVTVPQVKKTRWGIGIQGGYGVSDKGLTPYIGVGVSYNLLAW